MFSEDKAKKGKGGKKDGGGFGNLDLLSLIKGEKAIKTLDTIKEEPNDDEFVPRRRPIIEEEKLVPSISK